MVEMEFSEVVSNPHYAFPVVGVLLCALLVFAFGFKSPAQPPSFDFEDERKQHSGGPKKRKAAKKSSQNVHLSDTSKPNNERSSKPTIEKRTASPKSKQQSGQHVLESVDNKSVKANKKNDTNVLRNKDENNSGQKRTQAKLKKEDQAGEWVQLLSRKEKKSRKREEHFGGLDNEDLYNTDSSQQRNISSSANAVGSNGNSPLKKSMKFLTAEAENAITEHAILEENQLPISTEEHRRKAKVSGEQRRDVGGSAGVLKIKGFNMGSSKSGERSEVPSSKGIINNVEEQLPQNVTDVESSTNVKSSKRKSKNKITAESNSRGDSERNTLSSDAKKLKPQATNTPVRKHSPPASSVTHPVNTVVLDELADAWEEPKGQKKKKKARKDQ